MIELKNLNKTYHTPAEDLHVLKNIDLIVNEGDFVAVMGESGSGKSTLINIIGFLDNDFEGKYIFHGSEIRKTGDDKLSRLRNKAVGFIFQQFHLIENYTIEENVRLPLLYRGEGFKSSSEAAIRALERVGIGEKHDKYPRQLSGGQQQRAAIARAIVHKPSFIIADEPTGALDSDTSGEIIDMFRDLNKKDGITIIMVTHDPKMTKYCNKVFYLVDGNLKERRYQ